MDRFYAIFEVAIIEHIDIKFVATRHYTEHDVAVVGSDLVDEFMLLHQWYLFDSRVDVGCEVTLGKGQ